MAQFIGSFQFDNLVKGRVPFLFVNLGIDTSEIYPHVYKMHLERMILSNPQGSLIELSVEKIIPLVQSHDTPLEGAIIILCEDGTKSIQIADALEQVHYKNVFVVAGGWKQILADR